MYCGPILLILFYFVSSLSGSICYNETSQVPRVAELAKLLYNIMEESQKCWLQQKQPAFSFELLLYYVE